MEYCGIDLPAEQSQICILDEDGEVMETSRVRTSNGCQGNFFNFVCTSTLEKPATAPKRTSRSRKLTAFHLAPPDVCEVSRALSPKGLCQVRQGAFDEDSRAPRHPLPSPPIKLPQQSLESFLWHR